MKKKVLALLLVMAMALALLVGCGGGNSGGNSSGGNSGGNTGANAGGNSGGDTGSDASGDAAGGDYTFEIIVKSYQSSYWQAAVKGVEDEAEQLGVKVNCNGPNAESDIADQVNMLNNAINNAPEIGRAHV